jgi:hypothetical protein
MKYPAELYLNRPGFSRHVVDSNCSSSRT